MVDELFISVCSFALLYALAIILPGYAVLYCRRERGTLQIGSRAHRFCHVLLRISEEHPGRLVLLEGVPVVLLFVPFAQSIPQIVLVFASLYCPILLLRAAYAWRTRKYEPFI